MLNSIVCAQCGISLPIKPNGRPKRFCSDRCRQASHRNEAQTDRPHSPETCHETPLSENGPEGDFVQINEVTWKLASNDEFSHTPESHGQWGGYRTSKALAWVISVGGPGHWSWLARCDNRSTGPTTINKAKRAAVAMVTDPGMGKVLDDPISHLNAIAATLHDAVLA